MISIDNLTVSFGGWTLFDGISFLVNEKDRIGLVGKNGAGKTTILKLIAGLQQPTSGAVTKNGDCTIGYLPQQMQVADTTTLIAETAKAFEEVLAIEAEIERLTAEIASRTDYESEEYEKLLHNLNDANDRYHILGGDIIRDTVYQSMRQTLLHREAAPLCNRSSRFRSCGRGIRLFPLLGGGQLLRIRDETLSGILAHIQQYILHQLAAVSRQLFIVIHQRRIHNAQIQTALSGMMQKRGVHRLTHRIDTAE